MNNTQRTQRREGCDVYQIVTDRIIELLERGTVPWRKAWSSDDRLPMNLCSGKTYRGINVFLLHVAGYGSPYWLTLKQANQRGAESAPAKNPPSLCFGSNTRMKTRRQGKKKRFRLFVIIASST